jgi:hypothetical protein
MRFSYPRGEFSSFVVAVLRPYIELMKNRDLKQYPTPAELYALECEARAMRSREMARLVRRAVHAVRHLFDAKKGLQHA